jgi:hypothetical protein
MLSICASVPGHKTDIKDGEWIADLLRHGLLKASFIPPKSIRDLRDLVRARKSLVQQRAQTINGLWQGKVPGAAICAVSTAFYSFPSYFLVIMVKSLYTRGTSKQSCKREMDP